MARTRTLTNLIADVKNEGGYYRSKVFTDTLLTRWINQAIAEVYEHLANKFEGHYVTEAALVTVAGTAYVALPSDFWKLVRIDYKHSTNEYSPLRRVAIANELNYSDGDVSDWNGATYRYYIRASRVHLVPTPTTVDNLRIIYIPHSTDLATGSDTFDGINGYEDLVVQLVLRKCYQREQKDTRPAQMEISRQFERIDREAAVRDAAEPMPACDYGAF